MRFPRRPFLCLSVLILLFSCKNKTSETESAKLDSLLIEPDSINANYIDSNDVRSFFTSYPKLKSQSDRVFKFYQKRNFQYAWFNNQGLIEQAQLFANLADNYNAEGVQDTIVYEKTLEEWMDHYSDSIITIDSVSPTM